MSETIFEGATTSVEPVVNNESQLPQELVELVGEGKKYKSVDDALKSVPHAQKHIATLEEENARIKAELEKRRTAEELLADIRSGINVGEQLQTVTSQITSDTVEQTVAKLLAQRDAQSKAQNNVAKVISTFEQSFGDKNKAQEMYTKVASESGLSIQELNRLSATSPDAVLKLAGLKENRQPAPVGKVHSTVNLDSLNQGQQTELSARVKQGASTKDLVNAWKIAGEKVKQRNQ
jgi:hypothetical protein